MPSPREQLSDDLVEFLAFIGIFNSKKSKGELDGKDFWLIEFSKKDCQASLRVYGVGFIQLKIEISKRGLIKRDSRVFKSLSPLKDLLIDWILKENHTWFK